ncbi:hypothetical protein PRIPAC_70964 [Pristionchus pacificus]|uniref:Uncharacterized protein n=1 Tax=Pristionchus pacificus TaxID=54126 RepID=A0A2A6BZY5_PRIPA|nr:hypothetical protein PRIPAC_70964 [Pristionchus pacificus]|eukprot:PDM71419.1 hypothetical protein PRIPAC_37826 [Pristionchus pacificus]
MQQKNRDPMNLASLTVRGKRDRGGRGSPRGGGRGGLLDAKMLTTASRLSTFLSLLDFTHCL